MEKLTKALMTDETGQAIVTKLTALSGQMHELAMATRGSAILFESESEISVLGDGGYLAVYVGATNPLVISGWTGDNSLVTGHLYYLIKSGTSIVSSDLGEYGGTAVTDKTLELPDVPPDSETVGLALAGLKDDLDAINPYGINFEWELGKNINNNGTKQNNAYMAITQEINVVEGDTIIRKTPERDSLNLYLITYINAYSNGVWQSRTELGYNNKYVVGSNIDSIIIGFGRATSSGTTIKDSDIETYFNMPIYWKSARIIDTIPDATLTEADRPAEAKTAGDVIIRKTPIRTASFCAWIFGQMITPQGEIENNARVALSGMIPVEAGSVILNCSPYYDDDNRSLNLFMSTFDANETFIERIGLTHDSPQILSSAVKFIRLAFGHSTADSYAEMTNDKLNKYFKIKWDGVISKGDGQKPIYVAVGASTTIGAIHHYEGEDITYTPYAYPNYIGEILGLETYNLGEGSTGFIERNSGKQPNFMDIIYNNDSMFENADIITLMFGYGNDRTAGLPVGKWDDYFPYDAEECFFVSGDTSGNISGQETMLSHGATLMGCLNWCIKWIGEHYPKATLICISGAPSSNYTRRIQVISNSEDGAGTSGISPSKIIVNTPSEAVSQQVELLKEQMNIPIINMEKDSLPFSYYSTNATNESGEYAIFSTTGTQGSPEWNGHPNETGYLIYARYLAGRISQYFHH